MAKNKNKNKNKNLKSKENPTVLQKTTPAEAIPQKAEKNPKAKQKKQADTNKKKFGAKTKETFSELKKVAWPKFGKVAKATGVVIAVVAIFTVVLLGIDFGLSKLYQLLIK